MGAKIINGRNDKVHTYKSSENNLFQHNLNALKKHYPELAEKIAHTNIINFEIAYPGSSGIPNLKMLSRDQYYYDINNPLQDAVDQIKVLNLKNTRIAIFLGMGLGYELLCYTQHFAAEQRTDHIVVVEKDLEVFKAALESTDLREVIEHPCIKLFIGLTPEQLFVKFSNYIRSEGRYYYSKALSHVYHPSSIQLDRNYYVQVLKCLREGVMQVISSFGNCPDDSLIGLRNILANLEEIIKNPGINMLYNRFQKKPAIVVATGPSLNRNKHLLKGLEDKALIISVDASLRILNEIGVKPHLVTSLERVPETADLFRGFAPEALDGVYLAACPVVMPECYEVYPGPRIIVYRDFVHFRWIGIERGLLPIKSSAANMAFRVAAAMGCDPIILIGQDLAFSRSGETHAVGNVFGEVQEYIFKERQLEVMGNDGQPIRTTEIWYTFLKDYETDLAEYTGVCINSTEGGAYIPGTSVMPFIDAIDKFINEEFHPRQLISDILSGFSVEDSVQDLRKVLGIIDDTLSDLELMVSYCQEGLKTWDLHSPELKRAMDSPNTILPEFRSRLPEIEREILAWRTKCIQLGKTFHGFLIHIVQSYLVSSQIDAESAFGRYDDRDLAIIEVLLKQEEWFTIISDIIKTCADSLSESRKNLAQKLD